MQIAHTREKLVRDRIPERIRANGEPCEIDVHYRCAHPTEIRDLLVAKLREEVEEYIASPSMEELADIMEVVLCLAYLHHDKTTRRMSERVLMQMTEEKRRERGGFWQRFVLFLP